MLQIRMYGAPLILSHAYSSSYLLAKLHVDKLSDENEIETVKELRNALGDLPSNYEGAYDGVFERIRKTWLGKAYRRIEQFLFLIWQAKEPMSAPALENTLAVLRNAVPLDHSFLRDLEENSVPSSELVSKCAGLVEMDERSQIVRLAHQTIGNYLGKSLRNTFPTPDLTMAESCLSYLRLPVFNTGAYRTDDAEDRAIERLNKYCFLTYASQYWGRHAHNCVNLDLQQHVLDLVTNDNLLSTLAQVMRICDKNNTWDVDRGVTGLHVCAHFGLTQSVRSLLERSNPEPVDAMDSGNTTALMYAFMAKHRDTTHVLLDAGADITPSCVRGFTALHRACWNFDEVIWEAIVSSSKDISVNAVSQEPRFYKLDALRWAISCGCLDGVNLLLRRNDVRVHALHLREAALRDYHVILSNLLNHDSFHRHGSARTR